MSYVLLASNDLMLQARVEGAVRKSGVRLAQATTPEAIFAACLRDLPALLLVDLRIPNLEVESLMQTLRKQLPQAPYTAACGPHVQEALLAGARAAACDEVLTRGQIDREVDALVARAVSAQGNA